MHGNLSSTDPTTTGKGSPHVLMLPKWWPNPADVQLGDFLRKQAIAVSGCTKVSVLYVHSDPVQNATAYVDVIEKEGLWEAHSHFPANGSAFLAWRKTINLIRYWKAAGNGFHRVVQERGLPDITHVHILVRPALMALLLKRKFGIPYLLSEQSSEYLDGTYRGKSLAFKWLNQYLFARSSGVSTVSSWLGDGLVKLGLCRRFDVVPNVVPGLDRPLPKRGEPGHFLVVADLVDRTKNVSGVIKAIAQARRQDPRIHLTIIGDGPDRGMLEALALETGMADAISFLGRLPNVLVLDHMAQAGAVIVNSNVETFSVVTGEALAQGKPVIATKCGGPTAFITRQNGILIEIGDNGGLTAAILEMTAHSDTYEPQEIRMGVSARFSPGAVGAEFMTIYQRILHPRHG